MSNFRKPKVTNYYKIKFKHTKYGYSLTYWWAEAQNEDECIDLYLQLARDRYKGEYYVLEWIKPMEVKLYANPSISEE